MDATTASNTSAIEAAGMIVRLLPRQAYCADFTPSRPVVGFAYEVQSGVHSFGSDWRSNFRSVPNSLAFTPANCDVYSESRSGGEYLAISVSRNLLSEIAIGICNNRTPRRVSDCVLSRAIRPAYALRQMLLCADDFDTAAFETECISIVESAVCAASQTSKIPVPASSMTTRRLQLIEELVQDCLHRKLSVVEMASVVGLSTGYFIRAFRARIGQPPHMYLMNRRVSRARAMLETTTRTAVDIACVCGFSSQAHMTTAFRKVTGTTPSAYRTAFQRA